jgi:UDP-N-acetylmuramoyl-L-alanyl-D-glutamate--2,6-diaminopimelate ligase
VPGSVDLPPGGTPRPLRLPERSLRGLAEQVGAGAGAETVDDVRLTGIAGDSREVRPGDVYAALPGEHTHGIRFLAEARERGAVALLTDPIGRRYAELSRPSQGQPQRAQLPMLVVEQPRTVLGPAASWLYGAPSTALSLTGVTGTNGKTTTTFLIEAGLRAAGRTTGLIGTVRTQLADQLLPSARTTPEAPELQALFAVMLERGVDAATMEVSSHALTLQRVDGTRFAAAAFTNLSHDHLDFHGDLESYFQAKARLFGPELSDVGVVNIDDPYGRRLTASGAIPFVTVSTMGAPADWRTESIELSGHGSSFLAVGPGIRLRLGVRLPGAFNVANALLALAVLVSTGVDPEAAALGIGDLEGVPGRMERIEAGQPFAAIVDFAHTPRAVTTALETLRETTRGRLIAVVGSGGDRDRAKRPLMAAASARLADLAVLTSDNPRSEDPLSILEEMQAGLVVVPAGDRGEVVVEADREAAIRFAVGRALPGDTVVVLGKGHEQGHEVAGVVHPFDDRSVLRSAIESASRDAQPGSGQTP